MGIVVSAVATGLVHNIACSKEIKSKEDKVIMVEAGVETGQEGVKVQGQDSPQRIRTPGYPQILISSGRDSVSKVNKDLREGEVPPPPPASTPAE